MGRFEAPTNVFFIIADLLELVSLLIVVQVIVSWLIMFRVVSPRQPWVRTLDRLTEPILEPIRRLVPPQRLGGLDISPLIAIFAIQILTHFVWQLGVG